MAVSEDRAEPGGLAQAGTGCLGKAAVSISPRWYNMTGGEASLPFRAVPILID